MHGAAHARSARTLPMRGGRVQMLSYGCTRLEIGLQSIYEDVARDTNRGHTVAAVGECFRLAKDAGFKVTTSPSLSVPLSAPYWAKKYLTTTLQHSGHLHCMT